MDNHQNENFIKHYIFKEIHNETIKWPHYIEDVLLTSPAELDKAERVLELTLVTLQAYGGPSYHLVQLHSAIRRCGLFYTIQCDLRINQDDDNGDPADVVKTCTVEVLYEPWMKANAIAQATFKFIESMDSTDQDEINEKLVLRRKKNVPYYKSNELSFEKNNYSTFDEEDEDNEINEE